LRAPSPHESVKDVAYSCAPDHEGLPDLRRGIRLVGLDLPVVRLVRAGGRRGAVAAGFTRRREREHRRVSAAGRARAGQLLVPCAQPAGGLGASPVLPGRREDLRGGLRPRVRAGRDRDALPDLELAGGDSFPAALDIARDRLPAAELLQCDARALPYSDHFDVVVLFDLLEHVSEHQAVVEQAFRALRRGGGVLVAVPQHRWLWSGADEFGLHVRRYRRGEVEGLLAGAGFDVELSTSFVSLPLPGMVLARLRRRSLDSYDAARDLYPGRIVNAMLDTLLDVERRMIERGVSLPAGGSRFVVARKP